jgi:hypothetical protein
MRLFSFLRARPRVAPQQQPSSPAVSIELPPPTPRPRNAALPEQRNVTDVELPWLRLRLPGDSWKRSGNPEAFEYVNPLTDEQLIVMVVPLAAPLPAEQQRAALQALIDARRDAAVKLSDGLAELSVPRERAAGAGGHHEIRLYGIHRKGAIQFAFLARATATAVVNLSLYRYNVNPAPTPFALTAQRIFDRMEVK